MTTNVDDRHETLTALAESVVAQQDVLDRLEALRRLAVVVAAETESGIAEARANRYSWTDIAQRLGVSKQAAAQKYGPRRQRDQAAAGSPGPDADAEPQRQAMPAAVEAASGWVVRTPRGRTLLRIARDCDSA